MLKFKYNTPEMMKSNDLIKNDYIPKSILVNKFNEESMKDFRNDFCLADSNQASIIPVIVDSFGGHVYSLLSMIDLFKSSKKNILTIGSSKMMSCGSVLHSAGTKGFRYVQPNSTYLIHSVGSASWGKFKEMQNDLKEVERLDKLLFQMLDLNAGQNLGFFKGMYKENNSQDIHLTAEEAVKYGLADHIGTPSFEINITAEIKLVS